MLRSGMTQAEHDEPESTAVWAADAPFLTIDATADNADAGTKQKATTR